MPDAPPHPFVRLPARGRLRARAATVLAAAAIAHASPVLAQDVLTFSASQAFRHESNLLRLPSSLSPQDITGGRATSRSDLVSTTAVGVSFDRNLSLQRLRLDAQANASRFAENSAYDNLGYSAGGMLDWAVGRHWYGLASVRAQRALASFTDVRTGSKNLVDTQQLRLQAGYRFTPAWSAVAAVDSARRTNSQQAFEAFDNRITGVEAGARWEPRSGADWQFLLRRVDGRNPKRQVFDASGNLLPLAVDNGYAEDRAFTRLGIEPTDKSRLQGDIGYTRRSYDNLSQRDFGGLTFGLDFTWRATDALQLGAYARRDLGAQDLLTATHADTRSLGLRPSLRLTDKTSISGQAEHRRLKFAGDPGFVLLPVDARTDTITAYGGSFDWEVTRTVRISALLRWDRRDSTESRFDFTNRTFGVTGELRF